MGEQVPITAGVEPPEFTALTSAKNLTDVTGTVTVDRGNTSISRPAWSKCGVKVNARCGCFPQPYQTRNDCCNTDTRILPNWPEGLPPEQPIDPFDPDSVVRAPKIPDSQECKIWEFKPMTLYQGLQGTADCDNIDSLADEAERYLRAYGHNYFGDLLVGSTNGNPGLAAVATNVTPDGKVADCVALNALYSNHPNPGALVVPWGGLAFLAQAGLIRATDSGWRDVYGTRVVTGPGFKNLVGPGPEPWDCITELDAAALPVADPGCAWMYLVSDIWLGATEPITPARNSALSQSQVLGNSRDVIAEMEILAVFNPCCVYAAQVSFNKGVC